MNADFQTIVGAILFSAFIIFFLISVGNYINRLAAEERERKWQRAMIEASTQEQRRRNEAEKRRHEAQQKDNDRNRWEEQAKYLKEQEYQKQYHLNISFVNWEEDDETNDD